MSEMKKLRVIFLSVITIYIASALEQIEEEKNGDAVTRRADWLKPRPRSEIDLETEKQVTICAGQNHSIECVSPGSSISIGQTFWGRLSDKLCPSEDGDPVLSCGNAPESGEIIRNLCDGKTSCQLSARHMVLQRPGSPHCPGVNKYLLLNYTCVAKKKKFVLCNGESTKLNCGPRWKLNILSAFWGRSAASTCPAPLGNYLTCSSSDESLPAVKQFCHGKESCDVIASDAFMSRGKTHCPGVDKYAIVTYRCQPNVEGVSDGLANETSIKVNKDGDNTVRIMLHYLQNQQVTNTAQQDINNNNVTLPVPQYKQQVNVDVASKKLGALFDYLDNNGNYRSIKISTSGKINVPQDIEYKKNMSDVYSLPAINKQLRLNTDNSQNLIPKHNFGQQNNGVLRSQNSFHVNISINGSTSSQPIAKISGQSVNRLGQQNDSALKTENPFNVNNNSNTPAPSQSVVDASGQFAETNNLLAVNSNANQPKPSISYGLEISKSVSQTPVSKSVTVNNTTNQLPVGLTSKNVSGPKMDSPQSSKPQMLALKSPSNYGNVTGNLFSNAGQTLNTQTVSVQRQYNQQSIPYRSGFTQGSANFVQNKDQAKLSPNRLLLPPNPTTKVVPYISSQSPSNVQEGNSKERWDSLLKDVNNALGANESLLNMKKVSKAGKAKLLSQKAALLEKISNALDIVSSRLDAAESAEGKGKLNNKNKKVKLNMPKQENRVDTNSFDEKEIESLQKKVNAAIVAAENSNNIKLGKAHKVVSAFVPYLTTDTTDVSAKLRGFIQDRKEEKLKIIDKFQNFVNEFIEQQEKNGVLNGAKPGKGSNERLFTQLAKDIANKFSDLYNTSSYKTQKEPNPNTSLSLPNNNGSKQTSAVQKAQTNIFTNKTKQFFESQTLGFASAIKTSTSQGRNADFIIPKGNQIAVKVTPDNAKGNAPLSIFQQLSGLANKTNIRERGALTNIIKNLVNIIGEKKQEVVDNSAGKSAHRTFLLKPQRTIFPVNVGLIGGAINNEIPSGPDLANENTEDKVSESDFDKLIDKGAAQLTSNSNLIVHARKTNPTVSISELLSISGMDKSPKIQHVWLQKIKGLKSADFQEIPTDKPSKALISQQNEPETEKGYKHNWPAVGSAHKKITISLATLPKLLQNAKLPFFSPNILSKTVSKLTPFSKSFSSGISSGKSSKFNSLSNLSSNSEFFPTKKPRIRAFSKPTVKEGLVINLPNELLEELSDYLEISPDRKYLELKSGSAGGGQNLLITLPSSKIKPKEKGAAKDSLLGNRLIISDQGKVNSETAASQRTIGTDRNTSKMPNRKHSLSLVSLPLDEKQAEVRNFDGAKGRTSLQENKPLMGFGSYVTMGKINSSYEAALKLNPSGIKGRPFINQGELQGRLTVPSENKDNHSEPSYSSLSPASAIPLLSSQLPGTVVNSTEKLTLPSVLHLGSDTDSGSKGLRLLLISNDDEKNTSEFKSNKRKKNASAKEQQDIQEIKEPGKESRIDSIVQQVMNGLKTKLMEDEKRKEARSKNSTNHSLSKEVHFRPTLKRPPAFEATGSPSAQTVKSQYEANGGRTSEENSQSYGQYTSYDLPNNPYEVSAYSINPYSEEYTANAPTDETSTKSMADSDSMGVPNDKYSYSEDPPMSAYPQLSKEISVPDDPIMNALKSIEKEQDNLEAEKLKAIQKHNRVAEKEIPVNNKTSKTNVVKLNITVPYKEKRADVLSYFKQGIHHLNGSRDTVVENVTRLPNTENAGKKQIKTTVPKANKHQTKLKKMNGRFFNASIRSRNTLYSKHKNAKYKNYFKKERNEKVIAVAPQNSAPYYQTDNKNTRKTITVRNGIGARKGLRRNKTKSKTGISNKISDARRKTKIQRRFRNQNPRIYNNSKVSYSLETNKQLKTVSHLKKDVSTTNSHKIKNKNVRSDFQKSDTSKYLKLISEKTRKNL